MLEALIRTKNSPRSDKRRGDVICVKLKELNDWGAMERRVHMVVDWEDAELESSMRGELSKTGVATTVITPYKNETPCFLYDDDGSKIFSGTITKTRSEKYFDMDLGVPSEKSENQVSQEFEENKIFVKDEIVKEKPTAQHEQFVIDSALQEEAATAYSEYLHRMQADLAKYGIPTQIIDGKLVRRS